MNPGIYLLHKPRGETSFSMVRVWLEEAAKSPRKTPLCHGGTLDPFADGLLLMLVGQTTRLMNLVHPIPKTYVAEVRWGIEMDNGDLLGRPVFEGDASKLTPHILDQALGPFLGWTDQVPPSTSAKRIDGERAYEKVQRGEHVVLPPSRVFLHSARWLSHQLPTHSTLELTCKGGYYVRSLARDLGKALGCGAHLTALRRTAIGPWKDPGLGGREWIHGRGLFSWAPSRELMDEEAKALSQGRSISRGTVLDPDWKLPLDFPDPKTPIRGIHRDALVAMLREKDGQLSSFANLRGGL